MAKKKKETEQNKKKVNTDGVVGLVGSTMEHTNFRRLYQMK